jgi:protein O-mannosyl-transferase
MISSVFNKNTLVLAAICVITFICFSYTRHNQFTNWDDDFYVTNDKYIKAFTPENLRVIFTEDITKNNYHPLCMLSLAVNYHFSQLDPESYYLTNILIHIANVILVFFLLMQLAIRLKVEETGRLFIAGFGALWFGVHPMHVESVAWIAERKDVLYAFFYFSGMLAYLHYLDGGTKKWYWYGATYLLFAASCLSKPMAVVFPFSMLCLDLLMQRKWGKDVVFDKVIFFISSLICGGFAYYTQNKTGAVASFSTLPMTERFMYASYGYIMYISKLFNPTYLSTFYPYPYRYRETGMLHAIFYAAPLLAMASVVVPLFFTYKKKPEYFRIVAFGMLFFVANIMFVLQFISVGAAIMADRYSYVAYFGLLFLLFFFLNEVRKKFKAFGIPLIAVLLLASGALAYCCYERTFVWHDSESLLSDAIEKYPLKKDPDKPHDSKNSGVAMLSYKWRGNHYMAKGDIDAALADYEVLTTLRQLDAKVYDMVAVIYRLKKDYKKSLEMFNTSLAIQNNVFRTYVDRSVLYLQLGDTVNALKDYVTAVQIHGNAEKVLADSSFQCVQKKQFDLAIAQYNMMIKLNQSNPFYYFYRGVAYYSEGYVDPAIADWETAIKFNEKDTKKSASNNLSVAYDQIGKDSLALYYVEMAVATGNDVKPDFIAGIKERAKAQSRKK